jgi:invasion protein IalB
MPNLTLTFLTAAMLSLTAAPIAMAQDSTTEAPAEGTAPEAPVEVPAEVPAEAPAETPATEPAPADGGPPADLSLGQPADGAGAPGQPQIEIYVQSKHEAWELRCARTEDGSDPCQLYQLLKNAEGGALGEISMFPLQGADPAVAGATFVAPLGTLLTEQLRLQVDGAAAKVYPFSWCEATGCYARIGLTAEEIAGFKKGVSVTATLVPVGAPDQKVGLTISLKGFTAGYEALLASAAGN